MPDPVTTTDPTVAPAFPGVTVDRLQDVINDLFSFRQFIPAEQQPAFDLLPRDLLQCIRECLQGPSLYDQFTAKIGVELAAQRQATDIEFAKIRASMPTTGDPLALFQGLTTPSPGVKT